MVKVRKTPLPASALVRPYLDQSATWADCFSAFISREVSLEQFVGQFYRGRLFRFERWMIKTVIGRPSTDAQIDSLLTGETDTFSAWSSDARSENQLIMCDYQNRTCSWFMVETEADGTRLYFGTLLKPTKYLGRAEWLSKPLFTLMLPAHDIYSRLLLSQAANSLRRVN